MPGNAVRKGVFIIMNAGSGRGSETVPPEDVKRLFDGAGEVGMTVMQPGDDPAAIARKALDGGHTMIVAAGGDGTICGVAGALAGKDARLGVLPLGTFNFFARSLGVPQDLEEAARVILDGSDLPVDIGEINGKVFINNASLGIYAAILDQRETVYSRWGRSRLAAYWSVLVAMLTVYRPLTMRITVDGEVRRARSPMAFVAVRAYQLDEYEIEGADAIRDGAFAILLAPDVGRFALIWKALRIAFRGVQKGRDFTLLTGRDVLIETRRSHRLVARDGEKERMAEPYRIRFLPHALTVRVPRAAETAAA